MQLRHHIIAVVAAIAGTLSADAANMVDSTAVEPPLSAPVAVEPVTNSGTVEPDIDPIVVEPVIDPAIADPQPEEPAVVPDGAEPEPEAPVIFVDEPYVPQDAPEMPVQTDTVPAVDTVAVAVDDEHLLAANRRIPRSSTPQQPQEPELTPGQKLLQSLDLITTPVDPLPPVFFMPVIYTHYSYNSPVTVSTPEISALSPMTQQPVEPWMDWLDRMDRTKRIADNVKYNYIYSNPQYVRYNLATLPKAPKNIHATKVDPRTLRFEVREFNPNVSNDAEVMGVSFKKIHWMHTFNASLQFSQAYVSPNWYQGGSNNLTGIGQASWNLKLNQKYHPRLLFESTVQYKLGINSAPDDKYRNYNVTEDLFQANATFGLKAFKRWYYSVNAQFKTQMVNTYTKNTETLRSAFLSPGELNVGVGMTYGYSKPKVSFDASLSPLSYNMRTVINHQVDETQYDIEKGKTTKNKFGSSAEFKLKWKISYNITLQSRLFSFTNYKRIEGDWENTLMFEINRYLTTQVYVHARYDSETPQRLDKETGLPVDNWRKFQLKEILSLGLSYRFATK